MEMGYEYHTPRYSPSMYIQPVLDWVAIKKLFSVKQDEHYQESLVGFYDCIEILKRTLMGEMPDIQIPDLSEIKRQVILIHAYSDFFKSRLRRIDPVLGFTVCYSSLMAMAFILACKELGIMSVELQHGLQDDLHPAYGRWKRVPVSGYELLPSIFWCWGESEAMVISKWNSSVSQWHKSIVGGSPWVTLWKTGDSDFVSRYDQHVITLKNSHARSMHILLTLQTGLSGVNNIDNIVQSIRTTQHSWRWWIRVHPTTTRKDRDRIKTLLNDNGVWDMEVDNASTLPLYSLLRNVDVHITFSSATILEAISFGVPSVVTSEYGSEFFRDGIISGWVLEAYTPEQIVTAIESQYSKRSVLRQTNKGQSIADTNPLPTLYSLYIESRSSRVQQGKH
jgi:glycosyltransferase involved in cell wall biosynthesis